MDEPITPVPIQPTRVCVSAMGRQITRPRRAARRFPPPPERTATNTAVIVRRFRPRRRAVPFVRRPIVLAVLVCAAAGLLAGSSLAYVCHPGVAGTRMLTLRGTVVSLHTSAA